MNREAKAAAEQARTVAHAKLIALIVDTMEGGARVPCVGSSAWISENPHKRAAAAQACQTCPLIRECGDYATAHNEGGAVWGGVYRKGPNAREPKRKRATKTGTPKRHAKTKEETV